MTYTTRLKIARLARFISPSPQKISVSVGDILNDSQSLGIVNSFNKLHYESGAAGNLNWRGAPMIKNPCDLWMQIELLQSIRPSVVVETGTHYGASALFFAEMAKLLGISTTVVTVDINPKWQVDPGAFHIHSVIGYSVDPPVVAKVKDIVKAELCERPGPVIVTLDSDHSQENVRRELLSYSELVTLNSYLIVEDTNVNGHPAAADHGPGPWEAVHEFLAVNESFIIDKNCERFLLTYFPDGWLKRVR
jgi:cephalosporin hydroxylase